MAQAVLRGCAAALALAVVGALGGPAVATAATAGPTLEAERLAVPRSSGRAVTLRGASAGRALRLTGAAAATGRLTLAAPARIGVRVRGTTCGAAPRLVVTAGEEVVVAKAVRGAGWRTVRASEPVAAGRLGLTVSLRNPGRKGRCRRALAVDRLVAEPATAGAPVAGTVVGGTATGGATPPGAAGAWWVPAARTTWQWQLTGALDLTVDAQMYDVDLFTTPDTAVTALHAAGRRAVCYLSAGSYEPRRPDSAALAGVLGSEVVGWPGEYWLDVRRLDVLLPVMAARLDLCKAKGFDGAEFDNVDAYANRSGFPLTAANQIAYNRALAALAHARGLSAGLKNTLALVPDLVGDFDWALVEECYARGECDALRPFAAAGKAVFVAEYGIATGSFCTAANAAGYMAMRKNTGLDAFREPCWTLR